MYTVSEYTTYNGPHSALLLALRTDRMQEQVSKIEMYKKSMNNNYRKSISTVCLSMKNKTSHSVGSCGGPFLHLCTGCTLILVCTHLKETLVFYGASHHSVWFEGHFQWWWWWPTGHRQQTLGEILPLTFEATLFLKYKDGVSLLQQLQVRCISVVGVYTLTAASKTHLSLHSTKCVLVCVCAGQVQFIWYICIE